MGEQEFRSNNVLITVFELACNESADILIFDTGYGCRSGETESEFGPLHDATLVDDIVRGCMELLGDLSVAIVVPHGHPDHINPEFIQALESLDGYTIDRIYVHVDDLEFLGQPGFHVPGSCEFPGCGPEGHPFSCWEDKIWPFGESDCCNLKPLPPEINCTPPSEETDCEISAEESGLSFRTKMGKVWLRGRDGHTPGSVDLVLEHKNDSERRFTIYGSMIPSCELNTNVCGTCTPDCPDLVGVEWAIPAHGNIPILSRPPPAARQRPPGAVTALRSRRALSRR